MAPSTRELDEGFTLVELVIALLVLAVIMAAFAPAFYGMMRASAATDQRSVADGAAVAASEQVRSLPYYEVGYSSGKTPSYCTGSNPVTTDVASPLDTQPNTAVGVTPQGYQQTIQSITYTTQTCIYWVAASDGDTQAYKEADVRVLWGPQGQYSYAQTSAIYPGGESKYSYGGAADNFTPTTVSGATSPPPTPTAVQSMTAPYQSSPTDTTSPQTVIQVVWQEPVFTYGVQFQVEYWSGQGAPRPAPPVPSTPVINGARDTAADIYSGSTLTATGYETQISGLSPGTYWNFDVIALSGSFTAGPSNVVTAQTTGTSTGACAPTSINVAPAQPEVNASGVPQNFSYLTVTVPTTGDCSTTTVAVEYGLENKQGVPQAPLTTVSMSASGSTYSGQATQSTWQRSTYGFVVYLNGTATTEQANVTPCKLNASGGCT